MAEKKTLSAREIVKDLRACATDEFLMKKYELSEKKLQSALQKLVAAKLYTQVELDGRSVAKVEAVVIAEDETRPVPSASASIRPVFRCPACGLPQSYEFKVCPQCGIIVEKFQRRAKPGAQEPPKEPRKIIEQPVEDSVEPTLPKPTEHREEKPNQVVQAEDIPQQVDASNPLRRCPFCAEEIKADAIKCKSCGEWLNRPSVPRETLSSTDDLDRKARKWAVLCHLSMLICPLSMLIGIIFLGIRALPPPYIAVGALPVPFIIWLTMRGEYPFVDTHGKIALGNLCFATAFIIPGLIMLIKAIKPSDSELPSEAEVRIVMLYLAMSIELLGLLAWIGLPIVCAIQASKGNLSNFSWFRLPRN